jgi:hypothetical protein
LYTKHIDISSIKTDKAHKIKRKKKEKESP